MPCVEQEKNYKHRLYGRCSVDNADHLFNLLYSLRLVNGQTETIRKIYITKYADFPEIVAQRPEDADLIVYDAVIDERRCN